MPDITIDKLHLFVWVVLPGFVALNVYGLFCPPQKRDFAGSLIEIVSYSLLNLAMWSWAVVPLTEGNFYREHPVRYAAYAFGIVILSPAVLAVGWYFLRTRPFITRWIDHPIPTAWDGFFRRRQECWVLFTLKDGKKIGGFFGGRSYATGYPQDPEVYVEEAWRIDEHGRFSSMVEGSAGILVKQADCQLIEFFVKGKGDTASGKTDEDNRHPRRVSAECGTQELLGGRQHHDATPTPAGGLCDVASPAAPDRARQQ